MVLFLQPVFQERLWVAPISLNLVTIFRIILRVNAGQFPHIKRSQHNFNGKHKGKSLKQVWDEDKALFGNDSRKDFPLLTKILDAHDRLSVQVHPDDEYALKHEGEYGKTECWYILDAQPGAEIIYGVNATSKMNLNI